MCGDTLAFPLKMIFEAVLNDGVFPNDWKNGNIVPVHKKDLKTMLINYRPISLLLIFAKIFKRQYSCRCLSILPKISQFVSPVQVILALRNS